MNRASSAVIKLVAVLVLLVVAVPAIADLPEAEVARKSTDAILAKALKRQVDEVWMRIDHEVSNAIAEGSYVAKIDVSSTSDPCLSIVRKKLGKLGYRTVLKSSAQRLLRDGSNLPPAKLFMEIEWSKTGK